MPVRINNTIIVPAPTVTFSKEYQSSDGSGIFGANHVITLTGDLISFKGNPVASGSDPTVTFSSDGVYSTRSPVDDPINSSISEENMLTSIMKKQEALRNIITSGNNNNVLLEIIGYNQDKGIKAYCEVTELSFDDKTRWTNGCGYSISLSCNNFIESANSGLFSNNSSENGFTYYVSQADESWAISEQDSYSVSPSSIYEQNKIYTITHSLSANGKRVYDGSGNFLNGLSPILQASGYVHQILGFGDNSPQIYLPVANLIGSGYSVYNRKVTEDINQWTGTYGVQEEFTIFKSGQPATETVEISVEKDTSAFTRVNINGTIVGFNTYGAQSELVNKWINASGYYNSISGVIYSRANDHSPTPLNTVPLSHTVGKNMTEGVITYSLSYDNRPSLSLSDALTEDIQIQDKFPGQNISEVNIIGRSQPITTYLNSRSGYKRSLSITASMNIDSSGNPYRPKDSELSAIFEFYKPSGNYVYYGEPQESWSPKTGQYSYSIEWTYRGPSEGSGWNRRA